MIDLNNLPTPLRPDKLIGTVYGGAGVGKTYLASNCDNSVLLRIEDGSASLHGKDIKMLPCIIEPLDVFMQIKALIDQDHNFKTLIIDSVSKFDEMVISEYLNKNKSLKLSDDNYAGYEHVYSRHRSLSNACNKLSSLKNMSIIFISHEKVTNVGRDGKEQIMTLKMSPKSSRYYIDDVDFVGYLKPADIIINGVRTRAIKMDVDSNLNNQAKNRFELTEKELIAKNTSLESIFLKNK
tara:strand:+ start:560 stop:1273 length:714 start_codon:yes stop_codon:yes gene_type:complete